MLLLLLVPSLLVLPPKFLFVGEAHRLTEEVVVPSGRSPLTSENKKETVVPLPTIVDNLQEEEPPPMKRELDGHHWLVDAFVLVVVVLAPGVRLLCNGNKHSCGDYNGKSNSNDKQ